MSIGSRYCKLAALLPLLLLLAACSGSQSALTGLGDVSDRIVVLSWIMFIGAAVILILVVIAAAIALYGSPVWKRRLANNEFIIGLGIIFPVVTLSVLLVYGFYVTRIAETTGTAPDALRVSVVGHQWWWQIRYHHADGSTTETANELRIPVGQSVILELTSADVLHSFWVPAYAGKVDMVPGRTNTLRLNASEPGLVRGQCAEYCGGAHALMAFYVRAMPPAEFLRWLETEREAAPQTLPSPDAERGRELFLASGCGGCHTIRGTPADGQIGPDLTHVASRHSIGAGILPTSQEALETWLARHQQLKPNNRMPAYDFLGDADRTALAMFLLSME